MHRIWRSSLAMIATGLLAVVVVGAPASAASLHVTFQATQDNCVQGTADGTIAVELWNHANTTKLDEVLGVVPTSGHWTACFSVESVSSGKRLKAHSDTLTGVVSYTIPTLIVDTDRITDVVDGTGVPGHHLKIRLYDCNHLDFACVYKATRSVTVNSAGHYSKDMSSAFDARGFDEARVTDTNSAGHSFLVTTIFPWLAVAPDERLVFGESRGGRKVVFRLFGSPGGTLLQKVSKTPDFADYAFHFSHATSAGRQVTANFASDAKLTIPSTTITKETVGSDVILHVHCLPSRPVMVDFNPGDDLIYHTDSHGTIDVDATTDEPGWDPVAEGIILTCQSAAGDVITRRFDLLP